MGSLLAAVASFLSARAQNLGWLVRHDDLDTYRCRAEFIPIIEHSLHAHGLRSDAPPQCQTQRLDAYQEQLRRLDEMGLLYRCTCTRKSLRGLPRYPGTCRNRGLVDVDAATRVRLDTQLSSFDDLVRGTQTTDLTATVGDFIVLRRDGIVGYHLATAVDDGDDGITEVIRGGDLLEHTHAQRYLMQKLGFSAPAYGHIGILRDAEGNKLSKQYGAPPLDDTQPTTNLRFVLSQLGIPPTTGLTTIDQLLHFGIQHWQPQAIPTE